MCLTLETVIVNGCKRLTDRGLHVLAQCCPELRRLEVAGCYNISNEAVFEVVSRCPSLEHLNLSGKERNEHAIFCRKNTDRLTHFHKGVSVNLQQTCVALAQRIPHLGPFPVTFTKSGEIIRGTGEALPTSRFH